MQSSPWKIVNNEIVALLAAGERVAFSIHPRFAVQETISAVRPSDVNLARPDSLTYRMLERLYHEMERWRDMQFIDTL